MWRQGCCEQLVVDYLLDCDVGFGQFVVGNFGQCCGSGVDVLVCVVIDVVGLCDVGVVWGIGVGVIGIVYVDVGCVVLGQCQ